MIHGDGTPSTLCCVEGCEREGAHERIVELTADWAGITAAMTFDVSLCCEHLDMQVRDEPPFLDFAVVCRVRKATS